MVLPDEVIVYYVTDGQKSYYTFAEPDCAHWQLDSSYVMPFIIQWPELLVPQTVH